MAVWVAAGGEAVVAGVQTASVVVGATQAASVVVGATQAGVVASGVQAGVVARREEEGEKGEESALSFLILSF